MQYTQQYPAAVAVATAVAAVAVIRWNVFTAKINSPKKQTAEWVRARNRIPFEMLSFSIYYYFRVRSNAMGFWLQKSLPQIEWILSNIHSFKPHHAYVYMHALRCKVSTGRIVLLLFFANDVANKTVRSYITFANTVNQINSRFKIVVVSVYFWHFALCNGVTN